MQLHLRGKDFRRVVTKVTVCDDWMLAGGKASACKHEPQVKYFSLSL